MGGRANGSCRPGWPGPSLEACLAAERARGRCRRVSWPTPSRRASPTPSRSSWLPGRASAGAVLARRQRRPADGARYRHRRRRAWRRGPHRHVLEARPGAPPHRLGAPARPHRRLAGATVRGPAPSGVAATAARHDHASAAIGPLGPDAAQPAGDGASATWRRWSTSTGAGCASRCRSTARRRPPGPRPPRRKDPRPAPPRAVDVRRTTSTTRTRTPSTCWCSAARLAFEAMLARSRPARRRRDGDGWEPAETTRFGRYARRLWDGLLAHEQVVDR